ncbi:hypothetical protein G7Y89_g7045 [Cudoniella acicularis]|uniref:Uncharacterized protein n=1 Tax=Cudoniella acicularis TaxID=354080 RepID=A0A8H4RLW5_9HELO|nr:hypothetical protein G7Y89_g7045 [Cudoniella acicularis]
MVSRRRAKAGRALRFLVPFNVDFPRLNRDADVKVNARFPAAIEAQAAASMFPFCAFPQRGGNTITSCIWLLRDTSSWIALSFRTFRRSQPQILLVQSDLPFGHGTLQPKISQNGRNSRGFPAGAI